jgi:phospholipase C
MQARRIILPALFLFMLALPQLAAAQCSSSPTPTATPTDAGATPTATPTAVPNPVQHFVFIVPENHTFDNWFGTMPGVDGATSARLSTGATYPLSECADEMPQDLPHDVSSAWLADDSGKMDKFDKTVYCGPKQAIGGITYSYLCLCQYHQSDIPNLWALAQNYVLYDEFHTSQLGPSFPNHLFTVAGWANNVVGNPLGSPNITKIGEWGCDNVAGTVVNQATHAGTAGGVYVTVQQISPCMDFTAIPDLLNNAGLTWKYYAPALSATTGTGGEWNALDAISHIRFGSQWTTNISTPDQFAADASAGTLPNVSWVVVSNQLSGHPPYSMCANENTLVGLVNNVMSGPSWPNTAIFISPDDYGGFYDHVAPKRVDLTGLGFRVPLLQISAYSRKGFVSHEAAEFSSFATTIENYWNLPRLGGAARDAASPDLLDGFDFTQPPAAPMLLMPRTCP